MLGDWQITATGIIERVEKADVDKTGQGKKFFFTFYLTAEDIQRPEGSVTLPSPLPFKIKDLEMQRVNADGLQQGDRVTLTGRANGPSPQSFYLVQVHKLPPRSTAP